MADLNGFTGPDTPTDDIEEIKEQAQNAVDEIVSKAEENKEEQMETKEETTQNELDENPENVTNKSTNKKVIVTAAVIASVVVGAVATVSGIRNGAFGIATGKIDNEYVSVSGYRGIKIEKDEEKKITDKEVDEQIKTEMQANEKTEDVSNREIKEGDFVTCDYKGTVDGKEFEGGSASASEIQISKEGGMLEGFWKGFLGHKKGEEFDLQVTFPQDYGVNELNGKEAIFHISGIKKIVVKTLPKLDDKYVAKNVEGCSTVKEYKEKTKEELENNAEEMRMTSRKQKALQAVIEKAKLKTDSKAVQDEIKKTIEKQKKSYEEYAKQYGVSFSEFLQKYVGMNEEQFNEKNKEDAKETVKGQQVIKAIAKEEGLEATNADVEKQIASFAQKYGYKDSKEFMEAYKSQINKDDIKEFVAVDKVSKMLADKANEVKAEKADDSKKENTASAGKKSNEK